MVKRVRLPFLVPLSGWIGKLSSMIVASLDACGECRRNYMAIVRPGSTLGCGENRSGLTVGQR